MCTRTPCFPALPYLPCFLSSVVFPSFQIQLSFGFMGWKQFPYYEISALLGKWLKMRTLGFMKLFKSQCFQSSNIFLLMTNDKCSFFFSLSTKSHPVITDTQWRTRIQKKGTNVGKSCGGVPRIASGLERFWENYAKVGIPEERYLGVECCLGFLERNLLWLLKPKCGKNCEGSEICMLKC